MSESQSVTSSLPREMEKSGISAKSGKMGVAFDPSAGPGEPSTSKVSIYMYISAHMHTCIGCVQLVKCLASMVHSHIHVRIYIVHRMKWCGQCCMQNFFLCNFNFCNLF